jgi:hypothetical protein
MPLTITGDSITIDRTARTAWLLPGRPHACPATWLPVRLPDRRSAVTAITLALAAASGPRPGHRIWLHTGNRAAELGRITLQAITLAAPSPEMSSGKEPAVSPPGRESRP